MIVILQSPLERVYDFMGLLDLKPSTEQIASFLSKSFDPFGEICGVSVAKLQNDGVIYAEILVGFRTNLDQSQRMTISDDNPASIALRTGKSQLIDLTKGRLEYSDLPQIEKLMDYKTGIGLPVSESTVFGFALTTSIEQLEKHRDYFEVIKVVLTQFMSRSRFESKTSSHLRSKGNQELTDRQKVILEMLKEGRTNGSIASVLGYSESLIRQETIIIYRKLGVSGRHEIPKNKSEVVSVDETHSNQ